MNSRTATKDDLPCIQKILESYHLPTNDCHEHLENFIILEEQGSVIGFGGLEVYAEYGLLRSIAVAPDHTGKGIGQTILKLIQDKAQQKGVKVLYLLTETSADYFLTFGFSVIDRAETPESIAKTRQFYELCPTSAQLMGKKL